MLNVLYLLNYAGKAGTERYVETLVRQLGGTRIRPFFVYHEGGLLVERLEKLGVPTRRLEMRRPFDLAAARALAEICRDWNVDVVHCHYLRENYIAMLAKTWNKRLRVVYTNHFILPNGTLTRLSNRLMDARQDQMIAVCRKGKEQLVENGWSADKIQVVYNGVDLADWRGAPGSGTLRQELGIPADRFTMLCASRFAEDKGHAYLVRALKRLTQLTDKPFTMLLAGDGPLLEPTRALCRELGLTEDEVRFLGFREDMKNLYKSVDLYVNASRHEALSFLIIEAMAAGLPAVITNIAGNPDILTGPDQGGLLAEYDDPESMARAMLRFLEEPEFRAQCARRAGENIAQRFEIHKLAEDTYQVYQKAVSP